MHWNWPARGTSTVPVASAHFRSLWLLQSPDLVDLGASVCAENAGFPRGARPHLRTVAEAEVDVTST